MRSGLYFLLGFSFLFSLGYGQERGVVLPKKGEKGGEVFRGSEGTLSYWRKKLSSMQRLGGYYTLYRKGETLYSVITARQLNRPFFLAMTIAGGIYAGMQWDDMICYWRKQGKKLLLIRPDLRYRAPNTTFEDVVKRTYPGTILRALPILFESKQKEYVVDLAHLFKTDLAGVEALSGFLLGSRARFNPDLSRWAKIKVFPYNLEVEVDAAFTGPTRSGPNFTDATDRHRTHQLRIHYSLSYLPRTGYRPRVADNRVGYFHTAQKDFSRPYGSRTKFVRYITRWHLEKANPRLALSPPKKAIVFYIEKSVPYRFRKYVREGILAWNKAFERIGFDQAIEVRQQTRTEFADLDPEDVRYNFFRWVTNDFGFAAGPSRINPLTGEILDADIIFDDSFLRWSARDYRFTNPRAFWGLLDPKMDRMLARLEGWKIRELAPFSSRMGRWRDFLKLLRIMRQKGRYICLYSHWMKHQLSLARVYFAARGQRVPEEFLGMVVRDTVMHEVGHTLGLYHNFKASSWLSLKEINGPKRPSAITASVMDYNPMNFVPKGWTQGNYTNLTLGPYDYWAIEYGYRPVKSVRELKAIAQRCAQKALSYANDQFASQADPDPLVAKWDLGDDPMAFARMKEELARELMAHLLKKVVKPGEDYGEVRRAFGSVVWEYAFSNLLAARYIGGSYLHWDHKGDKGARVPQQLVPAKKQREALGFLQRGIFSPRAFDFLDPVVFNYMTPGTWSHWDSDEYNEWASYPIHRVVLMLQEMVLAVLLHPMNLRRVVDASLRVKPGEDVFRIDELLDGLTRAIWAELDQPPKRGKVYISSLRRNLQREYLNIWIRYFVLSKSHIPEDAKVVAWKNLKELKAKLAARRPLDRLSRAHLEESLKRVEKALSASFVR